MLFVADTAFHQIIQISANPDGSAGTESIFITAINASDGIMIERDDNIWIYANQIGVDKVIAKLVIKGAATPHQRSARSRTSRSQLTFSALQTNQVKDSETFNQITRSKLLRIRQKTV
jgi:hypothetical protein